MDAAPRNPRTVAFGNLAAEYAEIEGDVTVAIQRVLRRGWFVLGSECEQFERAFATYLGTQQSIACASGTEAIALALMACDVGPDDEVITVSHTAVPTVSAISMVGARPVFVDVSSDTCLMDTNLVKAAITPRTRAIVPVHLYGQCVDLNPLLSSALEHGIPVIEDCAQAHGATYNNRKAGTLGLMGAFSFYPSKNLGCYGDGGAVVTNDAILAQKLRMLRNYGQRERYYHDIVGINSRLDEVQAAVLAVKLPLLEKWNDRRRAIGARYNAGLINLPVRCPKLPAGSSHVFHLYVIQSDERDQLRGHLASAGVQTQIHYPVPVHLQRAYVSLGYRLGDFPVTEHVASQILSLPIYPQLTDADADRVVAAIADFYA